jgi:hypothetical protein
VGTARRAGSGGRQSTSFFPSLFTLPDPTLTERMADLPFIAIFKDFSLYEVSRVRVVCQKLLASHHLF